MGSVQQTDPLTGQTVSVSVSFGGLSSDCCTEVQKAVQNQPLDPAKQQACAGVTKLPLKMSFNGGACSGDPCPRMADGREIDIFGISRRCCQTLAPSDCASVTQFCWQMDLPLPTTDLT